MVARATRAVLAALACAGPASACGASPYACSSDTQCIDGGAAGYCEASGYCSFDDATCESGRRYGNLAPTDLAGECTLPGDEPTGSEVGSTMGPATSRAATA
jgi:hypothetical protein